MSEKSKNALMKNGSSYDALEDLINNLISQVKTPDRVCVRTVSYPIDWHIQNPNLCTFYCCVYINCVVFELHMEYFIYLYLKMNVRLRVRGTNVTPMTNSWAV